MRQNPRIPKYIERTRQMETHRKKMMRNETQINKKKRNGGNATRSDSWNDVFYILNVIERTIQIFYSNDTDIQHSTVCAETNFSVLLQYFTK